MVDTAEFTEVRAIWGKAYYVRKADLASTSQDIPLFHANGESYLARANRLKERIGQTWIARGNLSPT